MLPLPIVVVKVVEIAAGVVVGLTADKALGKAENAIHKVIVAKKKAKAES